MSSLKKLTAIETDARNYGFEWPNVEMILEQAISEAEEIRSAIAEKESRPRIQEEVGDLLHSVISLCMFLGYDVEQTLEFSAEKFAARMQALKIAAQKRGLNDLKGQSIEFMLQLWSEIK